MLKKIRNLFLTGILVLLPLITSVYILWYLFMVVDNWASPIVEVIFSKDIPGVGLILTILIIFSAGLLATNIIGKKIIKFGESILMRIPLFRNIYVSIKQFLEGMFTRKTESFKKAVIFEYPRKGLYQVGFITSDSSPYFNELTKQKMYNVFLPTTPNPTSDMFLLVPKKEIKVLNISVEEALKLVISAGILNPRHIENKSLKNMN